MSDNIPLEAEVMALRVVVHSTRAVRDGKSLNHWTIFLLLAEDQSVRINMRDKTPEEWKYGLPDDADYGEPGSMELTSHLYQISTSAIRYWDFRCLASHRVDEFINTLIRNGRGYYTMAVGGSGCRYWVYTAVSDFVIAELIQEDAAQTLLRRLYAQYTRHNDGTVSTNRLDTIPQGRFWHIDDWTREFRQDGR